MIERQRACLQLTGDGGLRMYIPVDAVLLDDSIEFCRDAHE